MTDTGPQQIARRLIESALADAGRAESPARAAALACDHIYRELSRWVGPDGCHALFARALAQAKGSNSGLNEIRLRPGEEPYVEGVAETIAAHGDASTAAALEAMLIHLIELLGRLVGFDMATTLVDRITVPGDEIMPASNNRTKEG